MELAQFGITVNNVLPGMTNTGRIRDLIAARAKAASKQETEIEQEMLFEIPAGRLAEAK